MTSNYTDAIIRGIIDDFARNAKTSLNIHRFLKKIYQKTFILVLVVAIKFFCENHISFNVQNCGPKFEKKNMFLL